MPRGGPPTYTYSLPAVYLAVPGTTILATQHNSPLEDIADVLNEAWPTNLGGTGGTSLVSSWDSLNSRGDDIPTASTIDLDAATGANVHLTGTTTITAVSLSNGVVREAIADSAFTITASSSLVVNGNTSGDQAITAKTILLFIGGSAGVVYVLTGGGSGSGSLYGYTTTATAAGTTTLTVASTYQQYFTGTTTQTVALPVTSTLTLGFSFRIVNNSTGAVTVNSSGGNLVMTVPAGTWTIVTCILLTGTTAASWSATPAVATTSVVGPVQLATLAQTLAPAAGTTLVPTIGNLYFPTGHLYGGQVTNNAGSAANKLDIAAATARDSTDTYNMVLSALTAKDITSAWAVGSSAGFLDTGSVANTTYYVYLIKRTDTNVVDAIASTSSSSPTLPTNYTVYRLIGQFTRASSTNGTPLYYGKPAINSVNADALYTGGLKTNPGLALLTSGTVSSAATLDIVLTSYTGYRGLLFELSGILPATTSTDLWMRFSTNGGSSYDAGSTDYQYAASRALATGAFAMIQSNGDSKILLVNGVDNTAGGGIDAVISMMSQTQTGLRTKINYQVSALAGSGNYFGIAGGADRTTAQDTDAVRFLFSSGNIASGSYAVYGYV